MVTADEILDLEWPDPAEWSPDSAYLATTMYEDDGKALFLARPGDEPWRIRPNDAHVTEFAWSPTDPILVCVTEEGTVVRVDPEGRTTTELARTPGGDASLAWSPDGTRIGYYREGRPWVRSVEDGTERGFDVPERGPYLDDSRMLAWREDGLLAYRFFERGTNCVGVIDTQDGELVWRTRSNASAHSPAWLGDGRLSFVRNAAHGTVREFVAVDRSGTETVLFREEDTERGTLSRGSPRISPDGTKLGAVLSIDGFEHVYVIDTTTGERTRLTEGPFEDKGLADSSPRWIDDRTLVFASNRQDSGQRQIYTVTIDGTVTPSIETPGTNVAPRPSPNGERLSYLHASRERSTEVRVREMDGKREHRVSRSAVEQWATLPIEPEPVAFENDGLTVHGYLLDPRRGESTPDDATDRPSIVYVHGGPMRQMRDGFHPNRSYGLAYAIQQYLASRGYVGLLVNYRGGIGYGRDFRGAIGGDRGRVEMNDIARSAEYLRELEYTSDSVGMWGLSYGGYAALQLPGVHPGVFDVTINLAGLADVENFYEWAIETKHPEIASATTVRMGGRPFEARDRWNDASPVTHMHRYETPIYSFHGTGDRYVNVEQQDIVVDALLDLDIEFEAEYYPGESHVFSRRNTWERTIEKLEAAFDTHL